MRSQGSTMGLPISKMPLSELRFHQRFSTQFEVFVTVGFVAYAAKVANISARGARIDCRNPMRVGTIISLKAKHLDVMARVVRATESSYGVKFFEEIDPLATVRQN